MFLGVILLTIYSTCVAAIAFYCFDPFFYRVACSKSIPYHLKKIFLFLQKKSYSPLFIWWLYKSLLKEANVAQNTQERSIRATEIFLLQHALRASIQTHVATYLYFYFIPILVFVIWDCMHRLLSFKVNDVFKNKGYAISRLREVV